MDQKEKTIQESWKHGIIDENDKILASTISQDESNCSVLDEDDFYLNVARQILINFTDNELKEISEEIEEMAKQWLTDTEEGKKFQKKYKTVDTEPNFILLLAITEEFIKFPQVSSEQFYLLKTKLEQKIKNLSHCFSTIPEYNLLDCVNAIFILKNYSIGEIIKARVLGECLWEKMEEQELEIEIIKKIAEKAAKSKKQHSLQALIISLLEKGIEPYINSIFKAIEKLSPEERKFYRIQDINDKEIRYSTNRKPTLKKSFGSNINKAKKELEKSKQT